LSGFEKPIRLQHEFYNNHLFQLFKHLHNMDKYMLLFRSGIPNEDAFQNLSPEEMQAEIQKWNSWIGGIAAQGKLISSEGLYPTGKIVNGSKHLITDGPFVESKEIVGGYLMMHADSLEEAIEAAKGCPVLADEGRVEVRPVQNFN
jgi:hypothetical protein